MRQATTQHSPRAWRRLTRLTLAACAALLKMAQAARPWPAGGHDLFVAPRPFEPMRHLPPQVVAQSAVCLVDVHLPAHRRTAPFYAQHNHAAYARRHGYGYLGFVPRPSNNRLFGQVKLDERLSGGPMGHKFAALRAAFAKLSQGGTPSCSWALWMDSDAIVTNDQVSIEALLRHFAAGDGGPKDILLAREHTTFDGSFLNAGVMLIKNSPLGHRFLQAVAELSLQGQFDARAEQTAVMAYVFGRDARGLPKAQRVALESGMRPEIGLTPQRALNSFFWYGSSYESAVLAGCQWQPCDFVGHLPGRRAAEKLAGMRTMMATSRGCSVAPDSR